MVEIRRNGRITFTRRISMKNDLQVQVIARVNKADIQKFKVIIFLLAICFLGLSIYLLSVPIISGLFILCSILIILVGMNYKKQLKEVDFKGDMLIVSDDQKSIVTSVNSLKKIKSRRFLFRKLTFVCFDLDGRNYNIVLLSKINESPGKILTELKKEKGRSISRVL